jgi:hypothetical protein
MIAQGATMKRVLVLGAVLAFGLVAHGRDEPPLAVQPSTWREEVEATSDDAVITHVAYVPLGLVERMLVDIENRRLADPPPAERMRSLLGHSGVSLIIHRGGAPDAEPELQCSWEGHSQSQGLDASGKVLWRIFPGIIATFVDEAEGAITARVRCRVDVGAQDYELRLQVVGTRLAGGAPLDVEWSGPFPVTRVPR